MKTANLMNFASVRNSEPIFCILARFGVKYPLVFTLRMGFHHDIIYPSKRTELLQYLSAVSAVRDGDAKKGVAASEENEDKNLPHRW